MANPAGPASPDGLTLVRMSCKKCPYVIAVATWCGRQECCEQDPGHFIRSLIAAQSARPMPVYAVRYADPAQAGQPDAVVTVWRPGNLTPVFTGTLGEAVRYQMRHACPLPDPPPTRPET